MAHCFPTYDAYYRGYGLTKADDGTCTACNNTPELYDTVDFPNIGTERYLLESCDPNNRDGQLHKSHHTEAEHNDIWFDGDEYRMRWCMGYVKTSRTKYLYRCFLIEKGYINNNN